MFLGPIPWLLTSELFDSEARAKANSVSTFTNWGCAFIITVSFPFLEVKYVNTISRIYEIKDLLNFDV
jgi:hypothetical protein